MTRLLLAEQVAGAANVKIVRGKLKACAQRVERLQDLQSALGLRRDFLLRWQREQRIGTEFGTPHSPAQLIELCQAEPVGTMHAQPLGSRRHERKFDKLA